MGMGWELGQCVAAYLPAAQRSAVMACQSCMTWESAETAMDSITYHRDELLGEPPNVLVDTLGAAGSTQAWASFSLPPFFWDCLAF